MPAIIACVIASACGPGAAVDDLETLGDSLETLGDSLETGDSDSGAPTFPDGDFGGVPDCGDGDGDPAGGGDTGTDETGDGDGDPPIGCDAEAAGALIDCSQAGACWAFIDGWSAWADYANPDRIATRVAANQIEISADDLSTSATCYDIIGSNDHMCVVCVDGVPLAGTPLAEIEISETGCAVGYPWEYTGGRITDPGINCWGVTDNVAIMVNPDH